MLFFNISNTIQEKNDEISSNGAFWRGIFCPSKSLFCCLDNFKGRGVTLDLKAGEIVGIAGVSGNGQKELAEVISGLRKVTRGQILLNENTITNLRIYYFSSIPHKIWSTGKEDLIFVSAITPPAF